MLETQIGRAYCSVNEVRSATGLSRDVIYRALGRGQFRGVKIGGRTLVDVRSVDLCFAASEIQPRQRAA